MATSQSHSPRRRQRFVRLELRLSPEQKALFKRAADLEGISLKSFIMSSVSQAARKVVQEHEVITLTAQDQELFVKMLLNPPPPNERLIEAMKRHKDEIVSKP